MLDILLLKGTLIGFSIAMPVGPIGMLCIRNSLTYGGRYGFMTGLGAAAADTLYGAIAGFGLAGLMTLLVNYQSLFQFIGGLFLCYLGMKIFSAKEAQEKEGIKGNLLQVFLSTFLLTLTNPLTILSFIGIYAGLGIDADDNNFHAAALLTSGVFIGSTLWWLILSSCTSLFKNKLSSKVSYWINCISGSLLICCGLLSLILMIVL